MLAGAADRLEDLVDSARSAVRQHACEMEKREGEREMNSLGWRETEIVG